MIKSMTITVNKDLKEMNIKDVTKNFDDITVADRLLTEQTTHHCKKMWALRTGQGF